MVYNQIVVVALLLLAPLAYGQLPGISPDLTPTVAKITGRICCTPTGNCGNGSVGVPGVAVDLNCTTVLGSVVTLGRDVTGLNGTLVMVANNLLGAFGLPRAGQIARCNVVARLPLNATVCPVLGATEGLLTASLTVVNNVAGVVNIRALPFQIGLTT